MTVTPTNEPVALNGLLSAAAALATPILAKWGIDGNKSQAIFAALGALLTAQLSIWAVFRARSQVTPVAAPKANDGTPLVPITAAAPIAPPAPVG